MNTTRVCLLKFVVICTILSGIPSTARENTAAGSYFWEDPLTRAIEDRNSLFTNLFGSETTLALSDLSKTARHEAETILSADSTTEPWLLLIYGVLRYLEGDNQALPYLSRSLEYAQDDPGTTWLLFTEFNRYHLPSLMQQALEQLEKQMFVEGAQAVPLLSRQLLQYGTVSTLSGDDSGAVFFYTWAHRFNPHEYDSFLKNAARNGIRHPVAAVKSLMEALPVIAGSWPAQFSLTVWLYHTVRTFVIIFLLMTGTILGVKYLPLAVHRTTHRYSESVPPALRTALVTAIILSLLAFGIVPFLWVLLLLLWKHCNRTDRVFGIVIVIILLLAPLDAVLANRCRITAENGSPASRFSRILYEGNLTDPNGRRKSSTPDTRVTVASIGEIVATIKKQDWPAAMARINSLPGAERDPFTADLKGIVLFCSGSFAAATTTFENVLELHPSDPAAQFNLARCYIASNDATAGMELLKKAADAHPSLINGFIQDNDRYFSDRWPPLRQVLFPEYPPARFWKEFFFGPTGSPSQLRHYWGFSFLGIPPLFSFFIFLILSGVLFFTGRVSPGNRKLRRLFTCKYCGRVLCRRCTSGILCPDCGETTRNVSVRHNAEQVRELLVKHHTDRRSARNLLFNLIFPGSGTLLEPQPPGAGIAVALLSTLVYTYWFTIVGNSAWRWMTGSEKVLLLLPPVCYHTFFSIRYLIADVRKFPSLFTSITLGKGA